jgi:hypothetical protein
MAVVNLNTGTVPNYAFNDDVSPELFRKNQFASEVEMKYAGFLSQGILFTCGLSSCSAICFYSNAGISLGHMHGLIDYSWVYENKDELLGKHGIAATTALLALTGPDDRADGFLASLEDKLGVAQTMLYVPAGAHHTGMMHFYICSDGTAAQFAGSA